MLERVEPSSCPVGAPCDVVLYGELSGGSHYRCQWISVKTVVTPATYDVESGGVACEAPASEAAKSLSVAVTLNGGDYTQMIAFKYSPRMR